MQGLARRPPGVGDDPAVGPPDPLPHVAQRGSVAAQGERRESEGLSPFPEERQVVPADVVAGDHVRVLGGDPGDEALQDLPFAAGQPEPPGFFVPPLDHSTEAEEVTVLQRVLHVEAEVGERGPERLDRGRVPHHPDHLLGGVPPGHRFRFRLPLHGEGQAPGPVVEVTMREGDVAGEHARRVSPPFVAVPVLRHPEGVADLHPEHLPFPSGDQEALRGEGKDLRVPGELLPGPLGGLGDLEVGVKVVDPGGDGTARRAPAVELHDHSVLLTTVRTAQEEERVAAHGASAGRAIIGFLHP